MRSYLKAWIRENLYAVDPEEYLAALLKKDSPTLHGIVKDLSDERMMVTNECPQRATPAENSGEIPDEQSDPREMINLTETTTDTLTKGRNVEIMKVVDDNPASGITFCNLAIRSCVFVVAMIVFFQFNSPGQNLPQSIKELFFNAGKQALKDTVARRVRTEFPFIIGRKEICGPDTINHPYYHTNQWQKGSLIYKAKSYPIEALKYNIETDNPILIHLSPLMVNAIALDENFIQEFSFTNRTFRYYRNLQTGKGRKLNDGYYEVVFDGRWKFLIRWEKAQTTREGSVDLVYNTSEYMYLLKENKMIRIYSLSGLIHQLDKERMSGLKRFIRDNELKISCSNYTSAAVVLSFYENKK